MTNQLIANVINDPQSFFERPNLSYRSREIQEAIDRFTQSASPMPVDAAIINLLTATKKFRYETIPEGFSAEARNLSNQEAILNEILQQMDHQFATAHALLGTFSEEENKILHKTISYCLRSVRDRMLAIPFSDDLFLLWLKSNLRRRIEKNS